MRRKEGEVSGMKIEFIPKKEYEHIDFGPLFEVLIEIAQEEAEERFLRELEDEDLC